MIRDFAEGDLHALLDLWQEAWQVTLPAIDFAARRPGFGERLIGFVAAGVRLRVACGADGAPLGFYTLDSDGYLDQVAVARAHWGLGVAAALIGDAKALAPQGLVLRVNQANGRAIAFYERQGFVRGAAEISPVSGLPLWSYRWSGAL